MLFTKKPGGFLPQQLSPNGVGNVEVEFRVIGQYHRRVDTVPQFAGK